MVIAGGSVRPVLAVTGPSGGGLAPAGWRPPVDPVKAAFT
jgi:hypothetical protein